MTSYPANTAGIIQALIDLQNAISGGGAGAQSVATLLPAIAGESLSVGDALYIQVSDGRVYKAYSNNSREKANVIGLAKEAVSNPGDQLTVVARGPIAGMSGLTAGLDYFLDNNGAVTTTSPAVAGCTRCISVRQLAVPNSTFNLILLSTQPDVRTLSACSG